MILSTFSYVYWPFGYLFCNVLFNSFAHFNLRMSIFLLLIYRSPPFSFWSLKCLYPITYLYVRTSQVWFPHYLSDYLVLISTFLTIIQVLILPIYFVFWNNCISSNSLSFSHISFYVHLCCRLTFYLIQ